MQYLYNAWYAAAWSSEVGQQLFSRTLLDVPVMFYRHDGRLIAMYDRCPHRFAPLSSGALVDGNVRCGYHGLAFDSSGTCVKSIFSSVAPKAARVRTFPTHEQDKLVWVWMGDLAAADVAKIPRLAFHADESTPCVFGLTHAKADYRLLSDNLMDLTHTALLHPGLGGLGYLPKYKCWEEKGDVISQYIIEGAPSHLDPEGKSFLDLQDKIRWIAPATHYLESRISPGGNKQDTIFIPSAHILTPETPTTTHYFWSSAAPPQLSPDPEQTRAVLTQAFDREDKPMVEAVQRRMGHADLWDLEPVLLPTDAGAVRVRRLLAALIAAEQENREKSSTAAAASPHKGSARNFPAR